MIYKSLEYSSIFAFALLLLCGYSTANATSQPQAEFVSGELLQTQTVKGDIVSAHVVWKNNSLELPTRDSLCTDGSCPAPLRLSFAVLNSEHTLCAGPVFMTLFAEDTDVVISAHGEMDCGSGVAQVGLLDNVNTLLVAATLPILSQSVESLQDENRVVTIANDVSVIPPPIYSDLIIVAVLLFVVIAVMLHIIWRRGNDTHGTILKVIFLTLLVSASFFADTTHANPSWKYNGPQYCDPVCSYTSPECTFGGEPAVWSCSTVGSTILCSDGDPDFRYRYTCVLDGVCGSTAGSCSYGTKINDNNQTVCGTTRTWSCQGASGGITASCVISNPSCSVDCVGSWSNTATCSVSCGGGVLQQVYSISTPASGGGAACPYAQGATRWGSTSCNTNACLPPPSCGTANGGSYVSAPSSNLCSVGTASAVSDLGYWSWSCTSGSATSCSATKITPAPTLNFWANSYSIPYNASTTLRWSLSGSVTSCTATGAWSGAKSVSGGSQSTGALTSSKTYNLQCTGPGGSTSLMTVTINVIPQDPSTVTGSCPSPGTSANVVWSAVSGAAYYRLSVDDQTTGGWNASCNASVGDFCLSNLVPTSRAFSSVSAHSYDTWVQACHAGGGCSTGTHATLFTCGTNQSPVVNAGADSSITLPTDSSAPSGASASDPDGGAISSLTWTFVSGSSTPSILSSNTLTPTFNSMSSGGTYVYRLTAVDDEGSSGSDTMSVVVSSPPPSYSCQGTQPTNATQCSTDPLTEDTLYRTVPTGFPCQDKCDYRCDDGYKPDGTYSACVKTQCNDDVDNDGDGSVDTADTGSCTDTSDDTETGGTPTISLSPRVVPLGESVTLTWDLGGNDPSACTLTANGIPTGIDLATPSVTQIINVRTTYVLTCGSLSDWAMVEVQGYGGET